MGTLFIVSTPIGNLEDITFRAVRTLLSVDIILCEDTRRTGLLLRELKQRFLLATGTSVIAEPGLISYYDQVENQRLPEIIRLLETNKNVALVSDSGTPLIADPGYKLVREARKRQIEVKVIPGATAATAALSISGLPTDKFCFLGYPPEKKSHRLKLFHALPTSFTAFENPPTFIFYCAPHKLITTLLDLQEALGDLDIVIARQLTKIHEEIWQGKISEARAYFVKVKGEIVILFSL